MNVTVLVVDTDPLVRDLFLKTVGKWGYIVDTAASGSEGLAMVRQTDYDVVFVNLSLPGMDGQELVGKIREEQPSTEVVVITGYSSVDAAVAAMKAGAYDLVLKPLNLDRIKIIINRCLEKSGLKEESSGEDMSEAEAEKYCYDKIIGKNHKMQEIYGLINSLRNIDSTVLIMGETGTGKGLLAQTIHSNSNRRNDDFVTVDCGAIPETLLESELFGYEKGSFTGALRRRIGKFEQAHKGTIFLDEIGDIPLYVQQKLLRILQERRFERIGGNSTIDVDVRIIAATNKDLKTLVDEGKFREDLYYRLNIIPICLPPLRERMDDLVLLVTKFIGKYRDKLKKDVRTISQDALNAMMRYHWPGNIRELENLLERAIIMTLGKNIQKIDIPGERRNKDIYSFGKIDINQPLKQVKQQIIEQVERKYLKELLNHHRGSINLVARQAKVDSKTLYDKMKKYNYHKEDFKRLDQEESS